MRGCDVSSNYFCRVCLWLNHDVRWPSNKDIDESINNHFLLSFCFGTVKTIYRPFISVYVCTKTNDTLLCIANLHDFVYSELRFLENEAIVM